MILHSYIIEKRNEQQKSHVQNLWHENEKRIEKKCKTKKSK